MLITRMVYATHSRRRHERRVKQAWLRVIGRSSALGRTSHDSPSRSPAPARLAGIHLLENLRLEELAAAGAKEFAFILQPLKIQGGTGSTVAPVAIR